MSKNGGGGGGGGELTQREAALLGVVGGFGFTLLAALGYRAFVSKQEAPAKSDQREDSDEDASSVATSPERRHLEYEIERLNGLIRINSMTTPDSDERQAYSVGGRNGLSSAEMETMREVFNSFDRAKSGCVGVDEVGELHEELGEPLTPDELKSAMETLDPDHANEVSFNVFIHWWIRKHCDGPVKSGKNRRGITFKLKSSSKMIQTFDVNNVVVKHVGTPHTRQYRVQFYYEQLNNRLKQISPWHDIPLFSENKNVEIFNFICEIPKWTRRKFEIATGEMWNPIKQDVKNGNLRNYKHGDMMFNYGAFPQTWENPTHTHKDTGYPGDNDPLDVLEVGSRQLTTGQICAVKVLGVLAMIDAKETDWKIIAININDPLAAKLNDIHDVDTFLPGAIESIREYLRIYKCWSGAPENTFAMNEECLTRQYAVSVIQETHEFWKDMRKEGKDVV